MHIFVSGQMWSARSSGCRVNLWNTNATTYIANYLKYTWKKQGLQGAYNDDLLKMLGPEIFSLTYGGQLAEYPGKVNNIDVSSAYQRAFAALLALIAKLTNSKWLSGNISGENLFINNNTKAFVNTLSTLLQEAYLSAGIGLTGYFGIQKMWDTFVYAKAGKNALIQGQAWGGARQLTGNNSRTSWERDIATLLSVYYLINMPNTTSFQSWGGSFWYGSSNTESYNYYKAGVPKNIAYQPTDMLKVDIGLPVASMSDLSYRPNREFMAYESTTTVPSNSYTVIGHSNESKVVQENLFAPQGYLETLPSFIYYLQREKDHPQIPHTPLSCVLAREYTKGLALYRTDVYGSSLSFLLTNVTVQLPVGKMYRRIQYNGNLGPPVTSVKLYGYEGAIFVAFPITSPPSISPSLKPSLAPTAVPSTIPTIRPTYNPTLSPTVNPPSYFTLAWSYNFTNIPVYSGYTPVDVLSWDWNIYNGAFGSSSNDQFIKSNAVVLPGSPLQLLINRATNSAGRLYSSAGIGSWSSHSQIYGRWEVKAKLPKGYGVTGYIGLFATNKVWPPEIDFAETIGRLQGNIYLTQHFGTWPNTKQTGSILTPLDIGSNSNTWLDSFHTFILDWTPTLLVYTIDGITVLTQPVKFNATAMDIAIGTGTGISLCYLNIVFRNIIYHCYL